LCCDAGDLVVHSVAQVRFVSSPEKYKVKTTTLFAKEELSLSLGGANDETSMAIRAEHRMCLNDEQNSASADAVYAREA
jgi:hypothetical protein